MYIFKFKLIILAFNISSFVVCLPSDRSSELKIMFELTFYVLLRAAIERIAMDLIFLLVI